MKPTTEATNRREAFLQALANYLTASLTAPPTEPLHNTTAHRAMIDALDRVLTLPEPGTDVAPGCVSVPIDALSDVLAWVELDVDLTEEMRQAVMVLGALAGDAISAQPEPGTDGGAG